MNEFLIELQAKLDEEKSKGNINSDINSLQGQLNKLKLQAELDPETIQNLTKEIEKVVNQKITISNVELNPGQIVKDAQKTGQQAGNALNQGITQGLNNNSNALQNFKKSLQKIGMGSKEIDNVAKRINELNVQIETLNQSKAHTVGKSGNKDVLSVNISGIDEMGQAIKLTQQYNIETGELIKSIDAVSTAQKKASSATDTFIEKQKKAVATRKNSLSTIESKLNDPNINKSLANTDFNANGLTQQLDKVKNAIFNLENASKETFTQAEIDVDKEINAINNLISTLKNAEYAATSLRTKDISPIKIDEGNKLDTFVQKMEQSGHYTDDLKDKVSLLKNDLSNLFDNDEAGLTKFLNDFGNLKTEFKKIDETAKTAEKESAQLINSLTKSYQTLKNLETNKSNLDVSKDINQIEELDKRIEEAKQNYDSLLTKSSQNSNFNIAKWNEKKSTIDTNTQNKIEYNSAKNIDVLNSSINNTLNNLQKLKASWEEQKILVGEFKTKVEELESNLSSVGNGNELDGLKNQIEALKTEATKIKDVKDIQDLTNGGVENDYSTQLAKLEGQFRNLGLTEDKVKDKTANITKVLDELKIKANQPFNQSNYQEIIALNDKLQKELAESSNEYTKLQASAKGYVSVHQRLTKANLIEAWNQKNSHATKEAIENNKSYIASLRNLNAQMTKMEFDEISIGFKTTENSMRGLNRLGASLKDQFTQAAQSVTQMLSVGSAVMLGLSQLRKIPKEVYEIDTSMTNLYKVTDETDTKYQQFMNSASDSAFNLGRSISSLIEQTANWAKLGYNIDESAKLAEISSIYANVGEVDDDTAVSDIVTAMKAFNLTADDSIKIVNSLNKLGNEFATDAGSLGEGLSKSASALAFAGNDIHKTLAMLTGGTEITQNASEMGNATKVLSMRIRGMKGELEELGEEYENVESISKIQTQILNQTKGTVNIFDDSGNFRATYDIIEDIAKIWDHISQTDQAALLETIAGKQRGNQVAALIQSFQSGQAQKAYEASINSENSAMQEQERWLESLEAKTQQFEAAFQSMASTVLDSGLLKGFVDLGTTGVKAFDNIISKIGSLGTFAMGAGLFASSKNIGKCRTSVRIS